LILQIFFTKKKKKKKKKNRYVEEDKRFPNYLDLPPYDRGKGHMQYKNVESDYTITNTVIKMNKLINNYK